MLKNKTFLENNSRHIKTSEISLETLVFWGDTKQLWFTCLEEIILVLDGAIVQCQQLENVRIDNIHRFEIKSKYGHISSSEINQKLKSYKFDHSYERIGNNRNNFKEDIMLLLSQAAQHGKKMCTTVGCRLLGKTAGPP